ncbi:MAG TPA: APC family permease [Candidatus Eisenbacteria bacterium]|nr:APC family permease [Candidatus Eisenbacteria bacterium]
MSSRPELVRRLGLGGAVAIGGAAMLGTGVFAAWTPALARSGSLLLGSLLVAALVAGLNAWSTAALARRIPQAGGAYAYGRDLLGRPWGVAAGLAFVVGKVASAGAAALTIGAYVRPDAARWVALAAIVLVLALDLRGVTRTAAASAVSVALVVTVLLAVVVVWSADADRPVGGPVAPVEPGAVGVLSGAAILFVAFAGYARIATLGEEVRDPARLLPRAIGLALAGVLVVYVGVGAAVLDVVGPLAPESRSAAPLEQVATTVAGPGLAAVVTVAAVVAAGGALLSLLAGIGRTLFAMGRGGDAPQGLTRVSRHGVPHVAQVVAGAGAAAVALAGGLGAALALSAATILTYYGIAHLAAFRLREGRPPLVVPVLGLLGCVLVAGSLLVPA